MRVYLFFLFACLFVFFPRGDRIESMVLECRERANGI